MILDGQHIYAKRLEFSYFEIASYIAKMIPQKIWEEKKLNIYERIIMGTPAIIIQKQILKEFLQDLSIKMSLDLKAIFTLTGKRIKTLIQIPMYAKTLIVSTDKVFKGLKGIEQIVAELKMSAKEISDSILKAPEGDQDLVHSLLQTACIGWMNRTKNLEHASDGSPMREAKQQSHMAPPSPGKKLLQDLAVQISTKQNEDSLLLGTFTKKTNAVTFTLKLDKGESVVDNSS